MSVGSMQNIMEVILHLDSRRHKYSSGAQLLLIFILSANDR